MVEMVTILSSAQDSLASLDIEDGDVGLDDIGLDQTEKEERQLSDPEIHSPENDKFETEDGCSTGLRRERTRPRKRWRRVREEIGKDFFSAGNGPPTEATSLLEEGLTEEAVEEQASRSETPHAAVDTDVLDEILLEVLHFREDSPREEVRGALKKLKKVARDGERKTLEPGLAYFLRGLYDEMEANATDDSLQERAIYIIGKLAREADWASDTVAATGGVVIVVNAMTKHPHSSSIQDRVVATLHHLTTTDTARFAIVDAKGAESVCWAMKEFIGVRNIQVQGSTALCNMAFGCSVSKKRIGKVGGIDAVVGAMETHPTDAELQSRCCLAIRNLTCRTRVNQWIAGRARGMEAIVNAINSLPDSLNVQYQGCVALANLCTEEPDNRIRAVDCGVVEAVLKVMDANMSNATLVEHILGLLRCLLHGSEECQTLVGEEDGVKLVVKALRQHILYPKVLENGCDVIRYLMFTGENRMTMYNCGGLEVLVRVMREGHQWKSVAESCLYALGNSAYDFIESKIAIGRHGGISILIDCMSFHMDCVSIQEHGCRALRNIADSDDLNIMLLGESGAIDSCIFACSGYPQSAQIQEHALAMIFNMTFTAENVRRMRGLDIERVLSHAQTTHPENTAVQRQVTALQAKLEAYENRPVAASKSSKHFNLASFASSRMGSSSLSRKASKAAGEGGAMGPKNSFMRIHHVVSEERFTSK